MVFDFKITIGHFHYFLASRNVLGTKISNKLGIFRVFSYECPPCFEQAEHFCPKEFIFL